MTTSHAASRTSFGLSVAAAEFREAFPDNAPRAVDFHDRARAWLDQRNNSSFQGLHLDINSFRHNIDWTCGDTVKAPPDAPSRRIGNSSGQFLGYDILYLGADRV